jgi:hypothetical protein
MNISCNLELFRKIIDRFQQVDVALAVVLMTPERNRETDFPFPWAIGSYNMIMPFPKASTNISAPWKPFNFKVLIILKEIKVII